MPTDLLIDGYNLMHAAGLARRTYGPGGLQQARERLLKRIASRLTAEERDRTTFVFDAKTAPSDASAEEMFRGVLVLYARSDAEADDRIEALIAAHSAPRRLLVVSSDHRLQRAARRRRARSVDSDLFLDQLDRRTSRTEQKPALPPDPKLTGELNPDELNHWLKEFAAIDAREMAEQARAAALELESSSPQEPTTQADLRAVVKPQAAPSRQVSSQAASVPRVDASPPATLPNEIAFWEERIRELLRDDSA